MHPPTYTPYIHPYMHPPTYTLCIHPSPHRSYQPREQPLLDEERCCLQHSTTHMAQWDWQQGHSCQVDYQVLDGMWGVGGLVSACPVYTHACHILICHTHKIDMVYTTHIIMTSSTYTPYTHQVFPPLFHPHSACDHLSQGGTPPWAPLHFPHPWRLVATPLVVEDAAVGGGAGAGAGAGGPRGEVWVVLMWVVWEWRGCVGIGRRAVWIPTKMKNCGCLCVLEGNWLCVCDVCVCVFHGCEWAGCVFHGYVCMYLIVPFLCVIFRTLLSMHVLSIAFLSMQCSLLLSFLCAFLHHAAGVWPLTYTHTSTAYVTQK